MKSVKIIALSTSVLAAAAIGTSAYAGDVSVTFNPGDVAYGYSDGYWTTKHEWRSWEKPEYAERYRHHPGARYFEHRHDRDPDMGWRGDVHR